MIGSCDWNRKGHVGARRGGEEAVSKQCQYFLYLRSRSRVTPVSFHVMKLTAKWLVTQQVVIQARYSSCFTLIGRGQESSDSEISKVG